MAEEKKDNSIENVKKNELTDEQLEDVNGGGIDLFPEADKRRRPSGDGKSSPVRFY